MAGAGRLSLPREGLFAFDPTNGKREFEFPSSRQEISTASTPAIPVVVKDEVLISECYGPARHSCA